MPIEAAELRRVMGHFATGVAVVTSTLDGVPVGMAANSLTSVSLDPPLVLFCADLDSETLKGVSQSGFFGVSVLEAGQERHARRFALKGPEKFDGVATRAEATGAPILEESLAWLDCRVRDEHDGGDHVIFVGLVVAAGAHAAGSPLIFYRGGYDALDD